MKLGLLTAILPEYTLAQAAGAAAEIGYRCLEVACWPREKATRRYAGTSHIDVAALTPAGAEEIRGMCAEKGIEISALCYYPNPLSPDPAQREASAAHLKKVMAAARLLRVPLVNTFIGRDKDKTLEENFALFRQVWPGLVAHAEEQGVKLGIENCPMYFTWDEWPGGNNLAASPAIWERMFDEIPSPAFGLNYDPSHLYLQHMDYIRPLSAFRERIFHVHFKDIRFLPDELDRHGVFAPPLAYMQPKLPGLGGINWGAFVSALYDIGYTGPACVEIEDRAFEGGEADILTAMRLSYRHLSQFLE